MAVTGKGGTGKTTIAALLAHFFSNDGFQVLAVDADPDAHLASAIGVPEELRNSIIPISSQRELIKERTGADPRRFGQLFRMNPKVADLPEKFCFEYRGIKLMVMGGISKGGGGCACPENILLRSLLSEVILNRGEVVIVDMEAGIEHLGRATARAIDQMLIMVEPGSRSVTTAKTILRLAEDIGIHSFGIIGNKIQGEKQGDWIIAQFSNQPILGMLSYHDGIRRSDQQQTPLSDALNESLEAEIRSIYLSLVSKN